MPYTFSLTPPLRRVFEGETGATDLADYFEFDFRSVGAKPTEKRTDFTGYYSDLDLPPEAEFDEWGIAHLPPAVAEDRTAHFRHRLSPLRNASTVQEIEEYPFPDVDADYRFADMAREVEAIKARGLAAMGGLGFSTFDHSWLLRGYETFLMDMVSNPKMCAATMDRVVSILRGAVRHYVRGGVDIVLWGEDVGTQNAMLMSPSTWRRWIKPRFASMIGAAKEVNPDVIIWYHSDGYIEPIIPDLIEIGVEVLNPVQPESMDPARIKSLYGDRLAFWGTVSIQQTMSFGTPAAVRDEVRHRIETVGRGGGFVLAPSHVLEPEVPWANVEAFVDAARAYGTYP